TWPDAGRARLEISPSTQTRAKTSSSSRRARLFSWLTLSTSRSRFRRSKGSLRMAAMIRESVARRVVAAVGRLAHGGDLALDQRLEGRQQGVEASRRLQPFEGCHDGLQGGQRAGPRRLAPPVEMGRAS